MEHIDIFSKIKYCLKDYYDNIYYFIKNNCSKKMQNFGKEFINKIFPKKKIIMCDYVKCFNEYILCSNPSVGTFEYYSYDGELILSIEARGARAVANFVNQNNIYTIFADSNDNTYFGYKNNELFFKGAKQYRVYNKSVLVYFKDNYYLMANDGIVRKADVVKELGIERSLPLSVIFSNDKMKEMKLVDNSGIIHEEYVLSNIGVNETFIATNRYGHLAHLKIDGSLLTEFKYTQLTPFIYGRSFGYVENEDRYIMIFDDGHEGIGRYKKIIKEFSLVQYAISKMPLALVCDEESEFYIDVNEKKYEVLK